MGAESYKGMYSKHIIYFEFPPQYKQIKYTNDNILGGAYLLSHRQKSQQYYTAKYYIVDKNQEIKIQKYSSIQNCLLGLLFPKIYNPTTDYMNILTTKQQIIKIHNVFRHNTQEHTNQAKNSLFSIQCLHQINQAQIGIVFDCMENDLQMLKNIRKNGSFSAIQIVRIIQCITEGVQYLQYYSIPIMPIFMNSVFTARNYQVSQVNQNLQNEIFKVLPLNFAINSHYFSNNQIPIPPQHQNSYLQTQQLYQFFKTYTINSHIYCIGKTILDLMINYDMSHKLVNNDGKIKFLKVLKQYPIQLINLLEKMVMIDPYQRIGITQLCNQIENLKRRLVSSNKIRNIGHSRQSCISDDYRTNNLISSVQTIQSARNRGQKITKKFKEICLLNHKINSKSPISIQKSKKQSGKQNIGYIDHQA